jgi:hypothetical protein
MKKFNWKTKKFIGGALTLVFLGFGLPHAGVIVPAVTDSVCGQVGCDA